ncbi:MAG: hypothetical protein IKH14_05100 [Prevotella sp.]|jgi:hypothetical protein|uniref:hypothetical protein n=1 Tax=Prevotella sp. Rep29 TaxID=2691580 RepID=UPI001B42A847|nr:hypothetical protein [Prevotella sp. Rep29]MBP3834650.1 hypothetical protein [Prevotella sp.]MBR6310600.1 hypothetical protein [Paludibacteraceae bacterium]MBQ3624740.1 hypothetical protein [Prevotella sp.]MBR3389757.1 hypothetical protein [Prevotella sp.]MBR3445227.1 hypothetical protein [Prevotella sp.]
MRLTKKQQQFIINSDVEEIVLLLQKEYHLSLIDAFEKVYTSQIYEKLTNTKTGLYLQSPAYIYDYLKEEIA